MSCSDRPGPMHAVQLASALLMARGLYIPHQVEVSNLEHRTMLASLAQNSQNLPDFKPTRHCIHSSGHYENKSPQTDISYALNTGAVRCYFDIANQCCDVVNLLSDGIQFFRSANGVVLSPGNEEGLLLPKYFKRMKELT